MTEAEALRKMFGTADKREIVDQVWAVQAVRGEVLSCRRPTDGKLRTGEVLSVPTFVGVELPSGKVGVNWRGTPAEERDSVLSS